MKKLVFLFCVLLALGITAHYNKVELAAWLFPQKVEEKTIHGVDETPSATVESVAEQTTAASEISEEVKSLQFAADGGDAVAQCNLGYCLEMGEGIKADSEQAVAQYRKSAAQGNAAACFNLARCYVNGMGVEPDVVQFIEWCEKAAELGNADAMYTLGMCYKHGYGVAVSAQVSKTWLEKAAALKHEKALEELKLM